MSKKYALLVGVPSTGPRSNLDPTPSLKAMTGLLRDLGGWAVTECSGQATRRQDVKAALEALIEKCQPPDTCLFYFFGHGGVVRFSGVSGALGGRPVFYLSTLRAQGSPMVGVLDYEISTALAALDERCQNVTAILDCCHAASIVRSDAPTIPPPAWVSELPPSEDQRDHLLAVESHPRVLRLFASSSQRSAYAQRRPDGSLGWLTEGFVSVMREANLRCERLAWDAVGHRICELTSQARGNEDQRIVVAGPRQRLVFSRETTAFHPSAAFIPDEQGSGGWIRAGSLQGVELGDHWRIAALTLGEDLQPRFVARAIVRRVELDRSEVALESGAPTTIPAGASAIHEGVARRLPVTVEASRSIAQAIEASPWLEIVPSGSLEVIARVRETSQLELLDADGQPLWKPTDARAAGAQAMLELLEDRARARRLVSALESNSPTAARDCALHWRWGRIGPDEKGLELDPSAAGPSGVLRLHAEDRIWIELGHRGFPPPHWFVAVIHVDVDGRLRLLSTREPEGLELVPEARAKVGVRKHRKQQGLPLRWPAGLPQHGPRRTSLLVIASHRPIALGHLVRGPQPGNDEAFVAEGMRSTVRRTRGGAPKPPVVSTGWTWGRIEFELDPVPRDGSSSLTSISSTVPR